MRKVYFSIPNRQYTANCIFYLIAEPNSPLHLPAGISAISNKIWVENMSTQKVNIIKNRGSDDLFSPDEFTYVKLAATFASHNDIYEQTGRKVS